MARGGNEMAAPPDDTSTTGNVSRGEATPVGHLLSPGEMARRVAEFPWESTPLGPAASWPGSLRTAVQLALDSGFPTVVLWGPDLVMLYNDAYAALIGGRHPRALGMPTHACWPETREFHEPIYARVRAGETVNLADAPLRTSRDGEPKLGYFTLSYVPVRAEDGAVHGVQVVLTETTRAVESRRLAGERDRLVQQLRAERDRLTEVFRSDPAFFVLLRGPDLVIELANDAYLHRVGRRDVVGRRLVEVLGELEAHDVAERAREAMRTGVPYLGREVASTRVDAATGARHQAFLDVVYQPLADPDGAWRAIALHGFEVTAEVLARRELESIYGTAPVGLCVLDRDLRFVRINERLAEINGLPVAAHLGRRVRDILPGIAEPAERLMQRVLATGEPALDVEVVGETPAQPGVSRIWMEHWLPLQGSGGQVTAINVVAQEVTEQRRAVAEREALLDRAMQAHLTAERARRMTEQLLGVSAALVMAVTPEEVATAVATAARAAVGADAVSVAALDADTRELRSLCRLGDADAWTDGDAATPLDADSPLAEAARTGEPAYRDSVVAFPCRTATQVVGVVVLGLREARRFASDEHALLVAIAQQGAAAFERASLFTRAEAASRAKSEFLAVMSHELRTPLNAIGGYASLIEMGIRGPVTPQQREDLRRIQVSQRHLVGLVDEVLEYARVESGATQYALAAVPVADAVRGAEVLVAPQLQAQGLRFEFDAEAGAAQVRVRADADKLQQVLLNLLGNAVKFTPRGGRVVVRCVPADDVVAIVVTDTGIGIAAERLSSIFEPFVQAEMDYTRSREGVGLGLAISRDLARGMGGTLTADSRPGAGSAFTLTLPRVV
ncbi:MAG TPA: PAS domain-containing protein [Gemmatimonadaceae bacterium]|nr:PAS domain-containing protein [Gemmatimonadaceae bacterium]